MRGSLIIHLHSGREARNASQNLRLERSIIWSELACTRENSLLKWCFVRYVLKCYAADLVILIEADLAIRLKIPTMPRDYGPTGLRDYGTTGLRDSDCFLILEKDLLGFKQCYYMLLLSKNLGSRRSSHHAHSFSTKRWRDDRRLLER